MPANLLTEWAALLMASFADAGVSDIVISPGSRSAPFVVAAVRESRLVRHSVMDERAAAFFALGQARVTRRPTVLLCTSGTAGAHYLPAIIEAGLSFVPMMVLTADRPNGLQACGASQTTDQIKLFGDHVRNYFELGMPEGSEEALTALRRMCAQATFCSTWPTPGPVHMNVRATKPLEPVEARSDDERSLSARVHRLRSRPITAAARPRMVLDAAEVHTVAQWCSSASRGLIVCGPAAPMTASESNAVFEFARATGFPIACEATSQLRFVTTPRDIVALDAFNALFRTKEFVERAALNLVVQLGAPPISAAWERFVSGYGGKRVVVTQHSWADPQSSASLLLFCETADALRAVSAVVPEDSAADPERARWRRFAATANEEVWKVVQQELDRSTGFTEGSAIRAVVDEQPRDSTLVIGNSLPVRLADAFCRQASTNVTVLSQRGASGIDGLVAGAAGASTKSASPLTLLIGDVSFLHDLASLVLMSKSQFPLAIVVVQNHGGRIFEQLPLALVPGLEREVMNLTVTPHDLDLSEMVKGFGVRWARATTPGDLREALRRAFERAGPTVIEAVVLPHGAAELHTRIDASCEAALRKILQGRDA